MRNGTCMWCSNTNPFKFKLTMSLWECGAQRNGHLFKAKLQSSCQTGLQLPYGNLVRRFSGGSLWGTWALLMWNHFGTILLKLLLGFVSILWLRFPTVRNWSLLPSMATKWMFTRMLRWVRWKCCAGVRIYHSNIRPWRVTSCFVSIHRTLPVTTPTQIWWLQSLRESKIWWTQTKLFHGASSSSSCSVVAKVIWNGWMRNTECTYIPGTIFVPGASAAKNTRMSGIHLVICGKLPFIGKLGSAMLTFWETRRQMPVT